MCPGRQGESEQAGHRTRILVVDDHPVVRFGLSMLLGSQPDFDVVGEAGSCAAACDAITRLRPDLVILDIELEDARGTEALARLRKVHPKVPAVVFTARDSDWCVVDAIRTGLQGYVTKGTPLVGLCEAVRAVARGGYYLDPRVASLVMGQVARHDDRRRPGRRYLTEREKAVLRLLAEGHRNKEIARALDISERTVKYHVAGLLTKLGASNRTQALKAAVAEGLISL